MDFRYVLDSSEDEADGGPPADLHLANVVGVSEVESDISRRHMNAAEYQQMNDAGANAAASAGLDAGLRTAPAQQLPAPAPGHKAQGLGTAAANTATRAVDSMATQGAGPAPTSHGAPASSKPSRAPTQLTANQASRLPGDYDVAVMDDRGPASFQVKRHGPIRGPFSPADAAGPTAAAGTTAAAAAAAAKRAAHVQPPSPTPAASGPQRPAPFGNPAPATSSRRTPTPPVDSLLDDLYAEDEAMKERQRLAAAEAMECWGFPTPAEVQLPASGALPGATRTYPDLLVAAVQRHATAAGGAAAGAAAAAAAVATRAARTASGAPAGSGSGPAAPSAEVTPAAATGSQLHQEVVAFAQQCLPTAEELEGMAAVLQLLERVARGKWPRARAVPFGSQPAGLALPGSDLDIAFLYVEGCPVPQQANGYSVPERSKVAQLLRALRKQLWMAGMIQREQDLEVVARARVPLLKGRIAVVVPDPDQEGAAAGARGRQNSGRGDEEEEGRQRQPMVVGAYRNERPMSGGKFKLARKDQVFGPSHVHGRMFSIKVDICLGVTNGPAAVKLVVDQVRLLPTLRPLVLFTKAVLKEANLNEVFSGGISSYALTCMVLAHLQAEGAAPPAPSGANSKEVILGVEDTLQHLQQLQQLPADAYAAPGWPTGVAWDFGVLLQGFFQRYGVLFDYRSEAVKVLEGGVAPKPSDWLPTGDMPLAALAIQDPQDQGRDLCGNKQLRLGLLRAAFKWAGKALVAAADFFAPSFNSQQGQAGSLVSHTCHNRQQQQQGRPAASWAEVQADGQHRTQEALREAAASATARAAAWQQQQEQAAAVELQRQLPLLGELITLWAALGRGATADQLRLELQQAALAAEDDMDSAEADAGVADGDRQDAAAGSRVQLLDQSANGAAGRLPVTGQGQDGPGRGQQPGQRQAAGSAGGSPGQRGDRGGGQVGTKRARGSGSSQEWEAGGKAGGGAKRQCSMHSTREEEGGVTGAGGQQQQQQPCLFQDVLQRRQGSEGADDMQEGYAFMTPGEVAAQQRLQQREQLLQLRLQQQQQQQPQGPRPGPGPGPQQSQQKKQKKQKQKQQQQQQQQRSSADEK